MSDGVPTGYWEWFRKDGTKLRSGFFLNGEQVGEWTTYDRAGKIHKVTMMEPKKPPAPRSSTSPTSRRTLLFANECQDAICV
jgi:hypothetical protein